MVVCSCTLFVHLPASGCVGPCEENRWQRSRTCCTSYVDMLCRSCRWHRGRRLATAPSKCSAGSADDGAAASGTPRASGRCHVVLSCHLHRLPHVLRGGVFPSHPPVDRTPLFSAYCADGILIYGTGGVLMSQACRICTLCCQQVCALQKQDAGEDEVRESLVAHRRLLDGLAIGPAAGLHHSMLAFGAIFFCYLCQYQQSHPCTSGFDHARHISCTCADLTSEDAVRLGRALVQDSSLGRGRSHILKWLLACIDASQEVRC